MKDLIKKNVVIVFAILVILVIIVTTFILSDRRPSQIQPSNSPSFSPQPLNSSTPKPEQGTEYQIISAEDKTQIKRDNLVGKLIKTLPHNEANFSLSYDYSNNSFTLSLIGDVNQANVAFDNYLKTNSIEDRSWLYNLKVE